MSVGPHVDIDLLADYLEGLLSGGEHARVQAHVAACAACAATCDQLSEVQVHLQAAGRHVAPMPPDVAGRIEAALADETRARAGQHTVVPLQGRHRRRPRRMTRVLSFAAGVALLGGGLATYLGLGSPALRPPVAGSSPQPPPATASTSPGENVVFRAGGQTPTLTSAQFSSQVSALVEVGVPASDKPTRGYDHNPGITVTADRCVELTLERARAGRPVDQRAAVLDGVPVTLVIVAGDGSAEARVYAIRGCPGTTGEIVRSADVRAR